MNFGVICEFNPFHKGHKYLFDRIKGENDCVICAMSGNFVQRGEAAVYGKFERSEEAIKNGADLVIEIPTWLSTLSAQGFAYAGVKTLEATGICEMLAFGAETNDVEALKNVAVNIKEKSNEIKDELKKGISYPAARQNIIKSELLKTPNNILGIEYLSCTKLKAVAVKRIGRGHDSDDILYSASEIRKHLPLDKTANLKNCEKAVLYKLRTMTADDFTKIDDVSEGLENRIIDAVKEAASLEELYDLIKTKRYTMSRIRRIVLRAFLGIDNSFPKEPEYIRVLGFSNKGKALVKEMAEKAELPVICKYSDVLNTNDNIAKLFEAESTFTDIHSLCFSTPKECGIDKSTKMIII